jgi:hypothetical protein
LEGELDSKWGRSKALLKDGSIVILLDKNFMKYHHDLYIFLNFRVLDKCPDGTIYIVMCFCCRTIEALGCAAYVTALFAITASVFPNSVSTVVVSTYRS